MSASRALAIAVAVAALFGSAVAAPIVYGVQYFDGNGAKVGKATLTLFVDNKATVWQDVGGGGLCWDYSSICQNLGFMTPLLIEGQIGGQAFRNGQGLFDQGSLVYDVRDPFRGEFVSNLWATYDSDSSLEMELVSLLMGPKTGSFAFQGFINPGPTIGTFRIAEIPLPAAAWVFLAGLIALRLRGGKGQGSAES